MNVPKTPIQTTGKGIMIVSLEPTEFLPFGRRSLINHPGLSCLHSHESQPCYRLDSSLVGSFRQVTMDEKNTDVWKLREFNGIEEELYVSGHTAIWSKSGNVIKTFTLESAVEHALWTEYIVDGDDQYLPELKDTSVVTKKQKVEGVTILTDGFLYMYPRKGGDFETALPFKVNRVSSFKFGLLLERTQNSDDNSNMSIADGIKLTSIFCLQHPLREFSPVVTRFQGNVKYMNQPQVSIVFCENDLILTYNKKHGLHTVWRARKINNEDSANLLNLDGNNDQQQEASSSMRQTSSPGTFSPVRTNYKASPASSLLHGSNLASNTGFPGMSRTPVGKNQHIPGTPNNAMFNSPINYAKTFSPASSFHARTPNSVMSHESLFLNEPPNEASEPLSPEVCLDHVWSERSTGMRDVNSGKAVKAFLTEDVCKQRYLAYLIDDLRQLRLVKYGFSNDQSYWIFGAMSVINAKDAAPLKNCNSFVVLDIIGGIAIYTGNVKMVKMHISGIPMSMSYSNILRSSAAPGTPQPISTPSHPSRPTSALRNIEEVGMLSPVPELTGSGVENISVMTADDFPFASNMAPINGFPQSIGSKVIIELLSGSYYKVDIPTFASTNLVEKCMKALYYVLPNDEFTQFSVKWYTLRHSPGSIDSYQSEWGIFEACLRETIGYASIKFLEKGNLTQSSQVKLIRELYQADGAGIVAKFQTADALKFQKPDLFKFGEDSALSPVVASKKARHANHANNKEWEKFLNSKMVKQHSHLFGLENNESPEVAAYESSLQTSLRRKSLRIETSHNEGANSILATIFPALHLVYEEQKLKMINWSNIQLMSNLLCTMAFDLGYASFVQSYVMDDANLFNKFAKKDINDPSAKVLLQFKPNVFENISDLIAGNNITKPFLVIPGVTDFTENIFRIYDFLFKQTQSASSVAYLPPNPTKKFLAKNFTPTSEGDTPHERMLHYMVSIRFTTSDLEMIPHAVALPLVQALHRCKENPAMHLSLSALKLLGRNDLILQREINKDLWKDKPLSCHTDPMRSSWQHQSITEVDISEEVELIQELLKDEIDGPPVATFIHQSKDYQPPKASNSADDNVTRLLFPNDHRMSDVRRLFQTDKPHKVDTAETPGLSHEDFMEMRAIRLYDLCNQTLSVPVGRGMVYLGTRHPVPTESLDFPKFELTGRGHPNNTTVDLASSSFDIPAGWRIWPSFHNGCAFGLTVAPQEGDPWWINVSKLKCKQSNSSNSYEENAIIVAEHAGFLLGLGLNGNLKKLHKLEIHQYLSWTEPLITVGLLLGLTAAKSGTCDMATMRMLSLHLPALLPPDTTQLEVPQIVQTAAAVAVGFLYMGSAKRLIVEVMLKEIDRPPNIEGDSGANRQAYALSCGIALGLVVLGKGLSVPELNDLNIPDQLYFYMTGRRKRFSYLSTQSSVMEGDQTNTDVTAPAAIVALALMFLKTNNRSVAEWFTLPNSLHLLEAIEPQHFSLCVTAHSLVSWDSIRPTKDWVEGHLPDVIRKIVDESNFNQPSDDVDMETVVQCHASIISGACFGLGLRFAGSRNKTAYETLLSYVTMFLKLWKNMGKTTSDSQEPYPARLVGRYQLESCVTTCLTALCMVHAGTGDLKCLQICNFLHVKLGSEISYGMQMAVHMALGLLFLGKCRKSLCTSNQAIASLLVSLHPCFPVSTTDNQYHLQALRHFYVLATEDRLLIPIDCETKLPCYAQVNLNFKSDADMPPFQYSTIAPCLLPEINSLRTIEVKDCRHWPLSVDCTDIDQMNSYIQHGLSVQRRAGYFPYIVDPKGYRRNLEVSTKFQISQEISSNSTSLQSFIDLFNDSNLLDNNEEAVSVTLIQNLVQDLVKSEETGQLFILNGLINMQRQIEKTKSSNPLSVWQLCIANQYINSNFSQQSVAAKFIAIMNRKLQKKLNQFLNDVKEIIKSSDKTKLDDSTATGEDIVQIISSQSCFNEAKISRMIAFFLYYKIPINVLQKFCESSIRSPTEMLKFIRTIPVPISIAVQLSRSLCL